MRVDPMPGEITKPGEECGVPREVAYPAPEYTALPPEYTAMTPETSEVPPEYDTGGRRMQVRRGNAPRAGHTETENAARLAEEAEDRAKRSRARRQLLRSFAAPVAAVIATVAVVFASFGYDPLGGGSDTGLYGEAGPGSKGVGTPTPQLPVPTPTGGPTPTPTPKLLVGGEGNSYASPVTWTMIHAEAPNGIILDSSLTAGDPMNEVLAWLATWNGSLDKSSMTSKKVFLGYLLGENALPVGDLDDPASLYVVGGEMYAVYREDIYYKAVPGTAAVTPTPKTGDGFPSLPNPDPDTEGQYAWNPAGAPEQYIMIAGTDGQNYYPVSGAGIGAPITNYPGAVYDAATNTLTLTDCSIEWMEVNLMGNSFTINLVGDNHIGQLKMWGAMYAGSVTLAGTGTLKVNENRNYPIGIVMNAEASPSALLVDRGIQVDVYGDVAIIVGATSLEKGIYCRNGVVMTGGECVRGDYASYITMYVTLANQYSGDDVTYYDYAVADSDGVPSNEVHFTDPNR